MIYISRHADRSDQDLMLIMFCVLLHFQKIRDTQFRFRSWQKWQWKCASDKKEQTLKIGFKKSPFSFSRNQFYTTLNWYKQGLKQFLKLLDYKKCIKTSFNSYNYLQQSLLTHNTMDTVCKVMERIAKWRVKIARKKRRDKPEETTEVSKVWDHFKEKWNTKCSLSCILCSLWNRLLRLWRRSILL